MIRKIFLLGRPGSGKSSVAQLIGRFARDKGWFTHHIYDYKLLQERFLQEEAEDIALEKRKFSPKGPQECAGFDVIDFSVLDTVLEMMANEVRKPVQENNLFLIEFARNDYSYALSKFGVDLLQDALLLYLDVDVETCIDRIHQRVDGLLYPYNHFVSDDIMRGYYSKDNWLDGRLQEYLKLLKSKGIPVDIWTIENNASYQALYDRVKQLVDNHLIPDQALKPLVSFDPLFVLPAKIFVLGLPGSGKSTVARHISNYARARQWSATHINDFAILYKMFKEDTQGQFQPAAYGGFDVHDLTVFDTALRKLEQKVKAHISTVRAEEIILIEFSRNDYEKAFQQFSQAFLQDAYFLYLDVDLDTCKRRIRARITKQTTVDDHYVSEYIFKVYYSGDNGHVLPQILEENYGIDNQRVMVIDNSGSQEDSFALINQFVDTIIAIEAHFLREIEPMQRITDLVPDGELKQR